jgi:hypothetical protein
MSGNLPFRELYPEFDDKVFEVRKRIQQASIIIKQGHWHDPTGFIDPIPISLTVGQHFLPHFRPVFGSEDFYIRQQMYSNIEKERRVVITDFLRRVNGAKIARIKHEQQKLRKEKDHVLQSPDTSKLTPSWKRIMTSTTSAPTPRRSPTPTRRSPSPRKPNPPPDMSPDKKRNKKPRRKFPHSSFQS